MLYYGLLLYKKSPLHKWAQVSFPSCKLVPYLHVHTNSVSLLHMGANKDDLETIKRELADSEIVKQCANRHNVVGDLSAMKICYLLRHHPGLSVSDIAELVGLSVSATSRSLTKLKVADIVTSNKIAQTVYYRLQNNEFTSQLVTQLEPQG